MIKSKLNFSAACMGMLIFGIVMAVLGSTLPSLMQKFMIDLADAGSLFLIMSLGILFGSMIFGPVTDRYGYKGLLGVSAFLIFAGIEGIAFAPSIGVLRLSLFIVGLGGGAINGGTNALVSDISEGSRGSGLSFLGVFFGLGAFGVPFILGTLLDHLSYETLIALVGALVLLPLMFFMSISFPLPRHQHKLPLKEGIGLTKESTLLLFGLVLFLQSGLEMTVGGWSAAFFNEVLDIEAGRSVLFLSFYWSGMIIARLSLGKILMKFSQARVFYASLFIAFTGSLLMLLSNGIGMAIPGLVITGLGFAAIFPLALAWVGDIYSRLSGTAFSLVLTIAILGGMLFPWITGVIANVGGLRMALFIVPFSLLCSALVFYRISIRLKKSGFR
jgi:MFS transporter, FHS family, glucose/mannose:H+ symporter